MTVLWGETTNGGTSDTLNPLKLRGLERVAIASGNATDVYAYTTTAPRSARAIIYAAQANGWGRLIISDQVTTVQNGWTRFTLPSTLPMTSGTAYQVMIVCSDYLGITTETGGTTFDHTESFSAIADLSDASIPDPLDEFALTTNSSASGRFSIYIDGTTGGPTIESAPSTLVRTGTGTVTVTSGDASTATLNLESADGLTVEPQTITNRTDNLDGTWTLEFTVVPGALSIGATDLVLRFTDADGDATATGITLRHPQVTVAHEDDAEAAVASEAAIEWWWLDAENAAPVDSGSATSDASGNTTLTGANTTLAPGATAVIHTRRSNGERAITDATVA